MLNKASLLSFALENKKITTRMVADHFGTTINIASSAVWYHSKRSSHPTLRQVGTYRAKAADGKMYDHGIYAPAINNVGVTNSTSKKRAKRKAAVIKQPVSFWASMKKFFRMG